MKRAEFGKEPEDMKPSQQVPPKVEYIAEHTVKPGESLSDISLKYYHSALREKFMVIYEANKSVIGDDPAFLKPGMVLKIPKP